MKATMRGLIFVVLAVVGGMSLLIGNPVGTAAPYADMLGGSAGNDHIIGGDLNDDIGGGKSLGAGDDWIEGGAGSDYLHGGTGNDIIEGGAGSDIVIVIGEDGNDWLFGGSKTSTDLTQAVADAIAQGNTDSGTGTKGDWLSGWGTGDDTLVAGAGNDMLFGGAGRGIFFVVKGVRLWQFKCEVANDAEERMVA